MREIKFRAWDRKAKAMFPVHNMEFGKISNSLDRVYGVDIHHKDSDFSGDVSYGGNVNKMTGNPLQPKFEVMQYTGLKDKNGVEIYEGDIVKAREESNKSSFTGYVHFLNGQYFVNHIGYESYYLPLIQLHNAVYEPIEIIGNIYDNPLEATP